MIIGVGTTNLWDVGRSSPSPRRHPYPHSGSTSPFAALRPQVANPRDSEVTARTGSIAERLPSVFQIRGRRQQQCEKAKFRIVYSIEHPVERDQHFPCPLDYPKFTSLDRSRSPKDPQAVLNVLLDHRGTIICSNKDQGLKRAEPLTKKLLLTTRKES